ncbi:MAG: DsbA family oxidoreductase [Acidimicrobiia bacterium]
MGLDRSDHLERRHGATVSWRAFELHPEIPAAGVPLAPLISPGGRFEEGYRTLEPLLAEANLPFLLPERIPRTRLALSASEWVRQRDPGAFPQFHRSLFLAHWATGGDIADRQFVVDLAGDAGADVASLERALDFGQASLLVDHSTAEAVELGVGGTPAFLFGGRFMLPGAQTREVIDQVVTRLGAMGIV